MLFNSFTFVMFFTLVFTVTMAIRQRVTARNWFLLFASYFFYGCWDPRFLTLIVVSTMIDYCAGLGIVGERLSWRHRIGLSVGLLGFGVFCLAPDWSALRSGGGLAFSGDWLSLGLVGLLAIVWPFVFGLFFGARESRRRKLFLIASLVGNLGILGFFKYAGFFYESAVELLANLRWMTGDPAGDLWLLKIVLPVGISFYTFQTLSYTIDVYRGRMGPERNLLNFSLFVAFFPQLVAGPIERASHLLPQMGEAVRLTSWHIHTGFYLICWGLFKKVVLADNVAQVVDNVFSGFEGAHPGGAGLTAYLGVLGFAVQIYCDFSGYTDIARGTARVLGFDLMKNFNLPYFAVNPSDFWRRWHISLSTWLRDYLYIPLGGNRRAPRATFMHLLLPVMLIGWIAPWRSILGEGASTTAIVGDFSVLQLIMGASGAASVLYVVYLVVHRGIYNNLMMTMLLGGLWHGAEWTFVLWGLYHGLLLMGHRMVSPALERLPVGGARLKAVVWYTLRALVFFQFTLYGWLLFRASSVSQVKSMTVAIFTDFGYEPGLLGERGVLILLGCTLTLFVVQFIQFVSKDLMVVFRLPWLLRGLVYALFILGFVLFGEFGEVPFIYFQF